MGKKNPWIAAILNLFLLGAGYLYNGKRILVGVLFIIASIAIFISAILPTPEFPEGLLDQYLSSMSATDLSVLTIKGFLDFLYILIPIALAYDAYNEAKEINRGKKK